MEPSSWVKDWWRRAEDACAKKDEDAKYQLQMELSNATEGRKKELQLWAAVKSTQTPYSMLDPSIIAIGETPPPEPIRFHGTEIELGKVVLALRDTGKARDEYWKDFSAHFVIMNAAGVWVHPKSLRASAASDIKGDDPGVSVRKALK